MAAGGPVSGVGDYNVLLIFVDDLKPKINAYGSIEMSTPNFDAFTDTAMTFTRAHCPQAVCGPSRTAVLTGVRPDVSGVWTNGEASDFRAYLPDVVTLPEHFGDNGYSVHGIGKLYHQQNQSGQDASSSWNDGWERSGASHRYYEGDAEGGKWLDEDNGDSAVSVTDMGEYNYRETPAVAVTDEDYGDGLVAQKGIAKLTEYADDYLTNGEHFFLALGFSKPHLPFACPKAYWDLYDPENIDLTGYDGNNVLPDGGAEFTAPNLSELNEYSDVTGVPSPAQARELIHGYMASVSYVDAQVGKVLDALEDLDGTGELAANTIVVILGDHGWHLADHGAFWSKSSNFEQSTRTALMIRAPGMNTAGMECPAPVELMDIYPTIVDLAGLADPVQPAGLESAAVSMRPLLEEPLRPWKAGAFSQFQRNISGDGFNEGWGMGYTIRTARYRYTEWWQTDINNRADKQQSSPEFIELYDYAADPDETVNLAGDPDYAAVQSALAAALDEGNGWASNAVPADTADAAESFTIQKNGTDAVLQWPVEFADYLLETSSEISGPYEVLTTPPTETSYSFSMDYPMTDERRFFRLRDPE